MLKDQVGEYPLARFVGQAVAKPYRAETACRPFLFGNGPHGRRHIDSGHPVGMLRQEKTAPANAAAEIDDMGWPERCVEPVLDGVDRPFDIMPARTVELLGYAIRKVPLQERWVCQHPEIRFAAADRAPIGIGI